jgi:CBS domain-containing protein
MNAHVENLMVGSVVTAEPHRTISHVRGILRRNKISALPIVDSEGHAVGIVSLTDLVADLSGGSPVSQVMTEKVYTVSRYDDVSVAARVMRNHRIHHVVVTDEKRVVGILSSFDLLKLVEDHRWVAKQPPTQKKRKGSRRNREWEPVT